MFTATVWLNLAFVKSHSVLRAIHPSLDVLIGWSPRRLWQILVDSVIKVQPRVARLALNSFAILRQNRLSIAVPAGKEHIAVLLAQRNDSFSQNRTHINLHNSWR
jgi:hypothetical protein